MFCTRSSGARYHRVTTYFVNAPPVGRSDCGGRERRPFFSDPMKRARPRSASASSQSRLSR
eukprot:417968-Pleurochrysis_carterae.AAC.1